MRGFSHDGLAGEVSTRVAGQSSRATRGGSSVSPFFRGLAIRAVIVCPPCKPKGIYGSAFDNATLAYPIAR